MPLTKIQSLGITDGTIVNDDINASAAIAGTKLTGVGKVLQYKQGTSGGLGAFNWNISSATFTNTGQTITITPTIATSKIIGIGYVDYGCDVSGVSSLRFGFKICRDSGSPSNTDPDVTGGGGFSYYWSEFNSSQQTRFDKYLVSPLQLFDGTHNTTSTITYRLYANSNQQNRGGLFYLNLFEIGI
jgi:hypothetical protein